MSDHRIVLHPPRQSRGIVSNINDRIRRIVHVAVPKARIEPIDLQHGEIKYGVHTSLVLLSMLQFSLLPDPQGAREVLLSLLLHTWIILISGHFHPRSSFGNSDGPTRPSKLHVSTLRLLLPPTSYYLVITPYAF
jgi:hypothetical protein